MAEPTKLDDVRAAILRGMSADLPVWHRAHGFFAEEGLCVGGVVTDLGRAALAAYDAEQRRAIRVKAMRECFKAVYVLDVDSRQAIEDLIAKEDSNG